MYNGNVQQNPQCVESCVTKDLSISPGSRRPTILYRGVNSNLLAHLCIVVGSIRRTLSVFEIDHQKSVKVYSTDDQM